jgi:serine phosphatase RsbU (regulator of sigma subunit)
MSLVPALRPHAAALGRSTRWQAGPFIIDLFSLCWLLSAFAFALIILLRSNRVSRERGLLDAEVASAREVQQVILPEAIQSIPGFRIESVYEPAREVGGDFFQILPAADNGVLLVVGDVAGKGLPAAMLVSLLVGTIRTAADDTHAPDRLLGKMNERLIGRTRGGFSTALVAHITSIGSVTIANAGHLPPYLDGKEVELPGALPLGIASSVRYETSRIRIEPSSRLTFYSDGVIEAQNKSGQLFGFDRARELSTQPAATIAEAAKAFGQKDDITVITVERVAVEVRQEVEQTTPIFIPAQ